MPIRANINYKNLGYHIIAGTINGLTLETWTAVNIGARPKILIVDFYWNDSGTIKFYFESSYCEGLVGTYHDYIRVTDNGFEYITKEAVVSQAKLVYTAIY